MSRQSVSCGGYGEEGVAHISKLNELLSLKVHDIWWDRNQLLVKHGKGGKDRVVMLSETLKQLLKKYFDEYMPQYWLFDGQDRHHKYSEKSVQQVVKQAASRVGDH